MAKLIKMPVLGQSVEEVRVLQWFKQEGDTVAVGEPLIEIETDKTSMEWESPEAGVVRRLLVAPDSYVKVEAPILIIGTADEPIDGVLSGGSNESAPTPATAEPVAPAPTVAVAATPIAEKPTGDIAVSPRARRAADEFGIELGLLAGRGTGPRGRVQEKDVLAVRDELLAAADAAAQIAGRGLKASPLARAVASGTGVDLAGVSGTGAGGRITADDVRNTPAGLLTPAGGGTGESRKSDSGSPTPEGRLNSGLAGGGGGGGTRTITLTGLRKRVADNLLKSVRNAPHVTLNLQADMGEATRLRTELLPPIEKATGVRLSPTDIIVKACAAALKEFPYINAHIDGDTITLFDTVNVGLAVSLGDEGLIVPVIKDVARKGLADIVRDRQEVVNRARAGKLGSADITGGTFTVTNLGNYGIESFNPIIPPPQVAILGVGAISDTVVARNGVPTVRPMMGLSLSFDHRAVDGAPAAAFLARIKEILESPYLLLL